MSIVTRRALLGAIAIAPSVGLIAGHAANARSSPDGGRWWRLYARMERAHAATQNYDREVYSPLHARYVEATGGVPFRDTPERIAIHAELGLPVVEDRSERLCEIFARLETRLIQTPAPDAKAALWKLDYLVGAHERSTDTPSWCKRFVAPIVADLRRFIGGEA